MSFSVYDLERIARAGGRYTKSKKGYLTCCFAHHDKTPSLSIALGRQGQLLLYCHAGCRFEDVMTALKRQGLVTSSLSYSGSGSVMYNSAWLPVDSSSTHEHRNAPQKSDQQIREFSRKIEKRKETRNAKDS